MLSAVDDGVGRVLSKLREHRIEEKTLVVFLSDNGGSLDPRSNGSSNRPLRAGKFSVYEGGIRVPFAVRWSGTLPSGTVYEQPVSSLDIFATAVALAGASPPPGHALDGVDLIPYLRGEKSGPPHQALFWRAGGGDRFAVRLGAQKLVEPVVGELELYDLSRDIGESNDLAPARAESVRQLARIKDEWNRHLVPPLFPALPHEPSAAAARGTPPR